jgi:hypothetical protein
MRSSNSLSARAGRQARLARQRRVLVQAFDGLGQGVGVFHRHQQAIHLMRDHLAAARRVGGDQRQARLQPAVAETGRLSGGATMMSREADKVHG